MEKEIGFIISTEADTHNPKMPVIEVDIQMRWDKGNQWNVEVFLGIQNETKERCHDFRAGNETEAKEKALAWAFEFMREIVGADVRLRSMAWEPESPLG